MRRTTQARTSAVYLRCYPRDYWAMQALRRALEEHALRLGLLPPVAYVDDGISSRHPAPRRADLEAAVAAGAISVVLIPGPWVFALDDAAARRAVDALVSLGCEVVELPAHGTLRHERIAGEPATARAPATAPVLLSPVAA
ncbi:hypothetical protein GCM10010495_72950 [Kitasatospora herbaricolor]|uniref:hypothetical protein n=1 Tax=Kitasatospora herbaricolor TaxID=68217 RepID=UPI00174B83F1|nr:hypothetical protein [Kitasatospora herbaricolor]MDQ0306803.1 hypothetical protein [Kitasatospora herbaricolor]GGV44884.1 hypothetical protein GCM10010495_72950 [Kitasatospora herbaricolor]